MSQYTNFPEPIDYHGPSQKPAVGQQNSKAECAALDLYNPFDENPGPSPPYSASSQSATPILGQTSSTKTTRNYGSYNTQSISETTSELLKRQEELEKKAQELDRRERVLNSHTVQSGRTGQNNWPPFPSFCPVGPCFYQDITLEISQQFQRTVTLMYYYWIFTACTLMFNLICCLALFCVDASFGVGLGLAILWGILFTPASFVCWYRPVYKAFRNDSSFSFFAFFFVFFMQLLLCVLMTIGIPNWGFSGWIVGLKALQKNVAVGVIMLVGGVLFTAQTIIGIVMLKKVHSTYRHTGASFKKAQEELATGVAGQAAPATAASAVPGLFSRGQ